MILFLLIVVAAIAARLMTDLAHWKIALAITCGIAAIGYLVHNPAINVDGTLVLIASPGIFGLIYLFLVPLGWLKSKFIKPNWGRPQHRAQSGE